MAVTTNIGLHIYTDAELESAFSTVRQWRNQLQGNNSGNDKSDFQKIDEAIGDLQAKKTLEPVNSLPTADSTEYAKHLLYSYNGALYFIVYNGTNYEFLEVGKSYTAGNGISISGTTISVSSLKFTNVTASTWVSDNTYTDYVYKCVLACQGVTSDTMIEVVFDVAEATSGDYAPVCLSETDTVTIYSKVNDSITIPLIKEVL